MVGAIAIFAFKSGEAEKAERDRIQSLKDNDSASQQMISQYQRQIDLLPKMVNAHNSLKQMIDSGTLSASKQEQTKRQLDEVSKALAMTVGEEGLAQLEAAGYTDEATKKQIENLNQLIEKQKEARKNVLEDQKNAMNNQLKSNAEAIEKTISRIDAVNKSIESFGSNINRITQLKALENELSSLEAEGR